MQTSTRTRLACLLAVAVGLALLAASIGGCTLFGPSRPDLSFSPLTLPAATVGTPYTATITVAGTVTPVGGASIQSGTLPDGMALTVGEQHDSTLIVSGTPTTAGTYTFDVWVWCYGTNVSGQSGAAEFELVVQ